MRISRAAPIGLCLLATPVCADPISGYVNADGSTAIPSTQYSVLHTKRGNYDIEFTSPMSPKASCLITVFAGQGLYHLNESRTACTITLRDLASRRPEDGAFSFMAVPMSQ